MRILFYLLILVFSSCNGQQKESKIIIAKKKNNNYHGSYKILNVDSTLFVNGFMNEGKKTGLWKYYENDTITKIEKYVKDNLYAVLDKDDYNFENIYLQKINSTISVPKKWEKFKEFEEPNIVAAFRKVNTEDKFAPSIYITYENLQDFTFEDFMMKEKMAFDSQKTIKILSMNKKNNSLYYLKYVTQSNEVDIAGLIVWKKQGNKVIIYRGSAIRNNMEKYKSLFFEIINTLTDKNE